MNVEHALSKRKDLQVIIKAYESFLRAQALSGMNRIRAAEAMAARDIVRTQTMSQVSKNRVDRITGSAQAPAPQPTNTGTPAENASEEIQGVVVLDEGYSTHSNLFRKLKDCIPCNSKWDIDDFDWKRLKEILTMDLKARYRFLLDLEDLFDGNPILDWLCDFLHAFKNLCPQDLLVLAGILMAYISRLLESISFNLESALNDILDTLLRPYIVGLEDFLGAYLQMLLQQINCILNEIEASAVSIRDFKISNTHGPKAIQFEYDPTGKKTDEVLTDIADYSSRSRLFLNDLAAETAATPTDVAAIIREFVQGGIDWVEKNLIKAQDTVIDLLGGEWLITQQNISFLDQVKAVATIIDICEVIASLGEIKELCTEDNVKLIVDKINRRSPNQVNITEPGQETNSTGSPAAFPTNTRDNNTTPTSSKRFAFVLRDCIKRTGNSDHLDRWMQELS